MSHFPLLATTDEVERLNQVAQTALDEVYDVYRALLALQIIAPAGEDHPPGCVGALAGILAHRLSEAYIHLMDEHHRCTCGALTPEDGTDA